MNYISIKNNQCIKLQEIPVLPYDSFFEVNTGLISENHSRHCVNYFAYPNNSSLQLICCIADDSNQQIYISSCMVNKEEQLRAFTSKHLCFEKFEREMHENFGLQFHGHPWLKPVRYAYNRADKNQILQNYPFYKIDSEELHEVGVGPIHAGVIEPGHFRFICNGEQILHLEIQLGYQHRGVEQLFLQKKQIMQRVILAESIAGDTAVGHGVAFAQAWESLCGFERSEDIDYSRAIALELERMAIHTGDIAAICGDIAYQLGNSVLGRLRTPIVNYFQEWCGNRLGKGLIRPCRNLYPFNPELAKRLNDIFNVYEPDFTEINKQLFSLPSALSRLERTGVVSNEDTRAIGAVGMSARMSNLERDIRKSHPFGLYQKIEHTPIVKRHGDVYSRVQIRKQEVAQSMEYIKGWLKKIPEPIKLPEMGKPKANSLTISLVEGWRGEICHCAITGNDGELTLYKIKDPSFHNWLALALAVRNNEISDFPVCNKSFNLSYCGNDL